MPAAVRAVFGPEAEIEPLDDRNYVFSVANADGRFVVRLARNEEHLATLRREEAVAAGLRGRVDLLVPDTRLEQTPSGHVAVHRLIDGGPLTDELWAEMTEEARARLVADLVRLYHQTHAIPLEEACGWLRIEWRGQETLLALTESTGKPCWFSPELCQEMPGRLGPHLDGGLRRVMLDTIERFAVLPRRLEYMVFGHGDLHGYNMAIARDEVGPRLRGVFDLGCTGIMDVHEDLFRLELAARGLLAEVVGEYEALTSLTPSPAAAGEGETGVQYGGARLPLAAAPSHCLCHRHVEVSLPLSHSGRVAAKRDTADGRGGGGVRACYPRLDRERLDVYYRAFLLYLMDEKVRADELADLPHLAGMLRAHTDSR